MPERPLAFFLTFRTYGTWLPGDSRGYVIRGSTSDTPFRDGDPSLHARSLQRMPVAARLLDTRQRATVAEAIGETCRVREWFVSAINVRTNHVHVVVSAPNWAPERVLTVLKAFATRRLREEEPIPADARVWARHGSTRYLWNEEDVMAASLYVLEGQDVPKPGS